MCTEPPLAKEERRQRLKVGEQLTPPGRDRRLADVPHTLTLVDGTLLSALPLLLQAMWLKEHTGSGLVK